jgi:glycosyltransferase involved in cell wall biosynthesis
MARTPRLLYVATEDWFFCSHFLPMARAARDAGFDVAVACRVRDKGAAITAEGFRLLPVEAERGRMAPVAVWRNLQALAALMRAEAPDIVHLIALRPIVLGGLAARLAGVRRLVGAVTGLGPLGGRPALPWRAARAGIRLLLRHVIGGPGTVYLFENRDDPPTLGLDPSDPRTVAIVNGPGIDPGAYPATAMPPANPLRTAMVSRMLWSKGVDVAVMGVRIARARGANVTLSLYGAPDPANRTSIDLPTLETWGRESGIFWRGPTTEVAAVWRQHHVAILPSHGEGMPRMLVEAACCGRALVATDVSGCRSLVQDGINGALIARDDADALADRLVAMAADPDGVARMGAAARATIVDGYTEAQVGSTVVTLYRSLLDRPL